MRILATTALVLAAVATPAFAQDADTSAGGVKVVAVGGFDRVSEGNDSATGFAGGLSIGYDAALSGVVVGGEVEGVLSTSEYCVGTACVEAGRDLYAGARLGVPVGGPTILYVKGGYTNLRAVGTLNGTTVTSDNVDGWRAGVGAETSVGKMVVRIEYRYSDYDGGTTRQQGFVGVGFRF